MNLFISIKSLFKNIQKHFSNKEFDIILSNELKYKFSEKPHYVAKIINDIILGIVNNITLGNEVISGLKAMYEPDKVELYEIEANSNWERPDGDYGTGIFSYLIHGRESTLKNTRYNYISIWNEYRLFVYSKNSKEEESVINFLHFIAKQKTNSMYERILKILIKRLNTFISSLNVVFTGVLKELHRTYLEQYTIESNHKEELIYESRDLDYQYIVDRLRKKYNWVMEKIVECFSVGSSWNSPKDAIYDLRNAVRIAIDNYRANSLLKHSDYVFYRFWDSCSMLSMINEVRIKKNKSLYVKKLFFKIYNKISLVNSILLIVSEELEVLRPYSKEKGGIWGLLRTEDDIKDLSIDMSYEIDCNKREIKALVEKITIINDKNGDDYLEVESIVDRESGEIKNELKDKMAIELINLFPKKIFYMVGDKILLKVVSTQSKKLIDRHNYLIKLMDAYDYAFVLPTIIVS